MADMVNVCGDPHCAQLLNEYRAEVQSLRVVLKAVETRKHRYGAEIMLTVEDDKARWVVTCAEPSMERLLATEVAEHLSKELGTAFRLVGLVMTGSGRDKTATNVGEA